MKFALSSAAVAALLASSAICQITIPPHASVYNGFSRGFNFTAGVNGIISQLDLPLDAYQAGDTASYMVRVNGVEVLRSVGNAGAINPLIRFNVGDVIDVIGNWSPATTGNFTAHNSYGNSAPYNTTILGVAHVLNRTGWQWDIGDSAYTSGTYLASGSGSIGRVLVWVTPPTGLYPEFTATPTFGPSPLNVQFTDQTFTSDPNGITSWAWDVDGDNNVDYTTQNPSHVYAIGGKYTVSLTVTDGTFGSRTMTKTDYIVVDPIHANFTASPTFGSLPLVVQFTDTTTGNPTAWLWDLDNDGTIDSTQQNPQWVYPIAGRYTVTLRTTNGSNVDSITKADLITVVGPTNNTRSAEILEFQFNEPRGSVIANTASTTTAPSFATVGLAGTPNAAWQGDAGRFAFMGNDQGTGCMAADNVTPYEARVDTGWPVDITGSHTVMFWTRIQTVTSYGYAFGSTAGSARCYHDGSHWSLRSWGSLGSSYPVSASNPMSLAGWNHWAIVIDDAAGTAQWYLNGVADGTPLSFTPNSFVMQNTFGNLTIGGYSTSSYFGRYADIDDFRLYGNALTQAQIAAAMASENPTTSTFGAGCSGPSTVPTIGASGGAPAVNNGAFAVTVGNLEAGVPQVLNIGMFTHSLGLPLDLSTFLGATYTGCNAQIYPDFVGIGLGGSSSAVVNLPIPNDVNLAGWHLYGQAIALGSVGAVSPALDINMQL